MRVGGADDGNGDVDGHDEQQDEERLRLGGERETVDGDASGVGGVKGGGEGGSSSASGREVVEVDWPTLLDGSRVLELLYRLEVLIPFSVLMLSVLRGWCCLRFSSDSTFARGVMARLP